MTKTISILSIFCTLFFYSCTALMEADVKDVLLEKNVYQNTYDADAAVMGVYSKLMGIAERVVILNELRADLMDVTESSTADMYALSHHQVSVDNEYCNPDSFYELILNCNEALSQFDRMKKERILDEDNYSERYADVMAIRCWTFLQIGIHFGKVRYVTAPINSAEEAMDSTGYSVYDLNALLPHLIADMERLPTLDDYFVVDLPKNILSGYERDMVFINKHCLLGDLYLWNNQYEKAAEQYYVLLNNTDGIYKYKATSGTWQTAGSLNSVTGFWINFLRYNNGNVNAYGNKWKEIFSRSTTDSELANEMIWVLDYDYHYDPEYPFIRLFANTGQGQYMLRPSAYAIDSLWENQTMRNNGFSYDGRGREASFDWVDGSPVIIKYLYDYYKQTTNQNGVIQLDYHNVNDLYTIEGRWFLYRAALLHLRYAEAVNRAGYPKLALAFLNTGIQAAFQDSRSNKTGCQYTGYPVYTSTGSIDQSKAYIPYPAPYYFDARNVSEEYGNHKGDWRSHAGLRGRANLQSRGEPSWAENLRTDSTTWKAATTLDDSLRLKAVFHMDSIRWVEEYLLEEAALELGFEGHRWGDLLRVSRRRMQDPVSVQSAEKSPSNLLNRQVSAKHREAGQSVPELNEGSWYLPMR